MTRKTRYFMLTSFAVLVAGLCAGVVAYYGGLPAGLLARQPGPEELAYVPADAAVVAFADVQQVMSSELRKRLTQVMPPGEQKGREELKEQTGIDLERDIDHVVACMIPRQAEGEGSDSGFVAFRGRFDSARLEALAREHGATVEDYKGKRIVRIQPGKHGDGEEQAGKAPTTMMLAFAEPGLVMFGDERAIHGAIDARAAGRDVRGNADMMRLVRDLEGTNNAWAVGRFDVLASRAKLPEGVSAQIPPIRWFAAAGKVNGGMTGLVRVEARDPQAAQNLRDVLNGLLALGRMQAGSRPELQTALQSITLSGTGSTVELSFTLPAELVDLLGAAAKKTTDE